VKEEAEADSDLTGEWTQDEINCFQNKEYADSRFRLMTRDAMR